MQVEWKLSGETLERKPEDRLQGGRGGGGNAQGGKEPPRRWKAKAGECSREEGGVL